MNWKTIIWINIIISLIISLAISLWGLLFTQSGLTCILLNPPKCELPGWLMQVLILFVVIFIILIILGAIIKTKMSGIGGMGKFKMPKIKKSKMPKEEKIPELGKDLELPDIDLDSNKKIKI